MRMVVPPNPLKIMPLSAGYAAFFSVAAFFFRRGRGSFQRLWIHQY